MSNSDWISYNLWFFCAYLLASLRASLYFECSYDICLSFYCISFFKSCTKFYNNICLVLLWNLPSRIEPTVGMLQGFSELFASPNCGDSILLEFLLIYPEWFRILWGFMSRPRPTFTMFPVTFVLHYNYFEDSDYTVSFLPKWGCSYCFVDALATFRLLACSHLFVLAL